MLNYIQTYKERSNKSHCGSFSWIQKPLGKNRIQSGPNFMALLSAEFCAYDHHSPIAMQALIFCTSCVSEEHLVVWSKHAKQQQIPAYSWNTHDESEEYFAYGKRGHESPQSSLFSWGCGNVSAKAGEFLSTVCVTNCLYSI